MLNLSKEQPTAALIDELVTKIFEVGNCSLLDQLVDTEDIVDCCGTGGSGIAHYNTSTSVSFVLAAGGLRVAKFGNRAASGSSGSFDFLECLGIPATLPSNQLLETLRKTNLVFLFAPQFYPSLAKLAPIRKALGRPTVLNLIGPLLNPFRPSFRVLGAATNDAQQALAGYLFSYTDSKKALVVHADSGLDELDPASSNTIITINKLAMNKPAISESILNFGLDKEIQDSKLLTPKENARLFRQIITDFSSSPHYFRALVTLNAAAGFFVTGKTASIEEGQELASELLSSGKVLAKYEQCRSTYAQFTE